QRSPRRRHPVLRAGEPVMQVDVQTEAVIRRPRQVVAEYAGEPGNAPEWYANIRSVQWRTPPPLAAGSRLDFVAEFLGRRLAYTHEVIELVRGSGWSCAPPTDRSPWRPPTPGPTPAARTPG